jgi:hypothetical protein
MIVASANAAFTPTRGLLERCENPMEPIDGDINITANQEFQQAHKQAIPSPSHSSSLDQHSWGFDDFLAGLSPGFDYCDPVIESHIDHILPHQGIDEPGGGGVLLEEINDSPQDTLMHSSITHSAALEPQQNYVKEKSQSPSQSGREEYAQEEIQKSDKSSLQPREGEDLIEAYISAPWEKHMEMVITGSGDTNIESRIQLDNQESCERGMKRKKINSSETSNSLQEERQRKPMEYVNKRSSLSFLGKNSQVLSSPKDNTGKEKDLSCNAIDPNQQISLLIASSKFPHHHSSNYNQGFSEIISNLAMQLKPKLPRLSLAEDMFMPNIQNLQPHGPGHSDTIHHLARDDVLSTFTPEGPNWYGEVSSMEKKLKSINSNYKNDVLKIWVKFLKYKETWYIYWKDQTQVNFKEYCERYISNLLLQEVFPLFLSIADFILALMTQDQVKTVASERLKYSQDLANASHFFRVFANGVEVPDGLDYYEWKNELSSLSCALLNTRREYRRRDIVWIFLKLWIKIYHARALISCKEFEYGRLSDKFNSDIQVLYCYKIPSLIEKYSQMIMEQKLTL